MTAKTTANRKLSFRTGVAFALRGPSYSNNLSSELCLQRRINHRRRTMIQTARGIFNDQ
jgi:hypothetical protein